MSGKSILLLFGSKFKGIFESYEFMNGENYAFMDGTEYEFN